MNKLSIRLIPALALLLLLSACDRNGGGAGSGAVDAGPIKPEAKFVLLYDTGRIGELVDCGCPSHPRGGLARLAEVARGLSGANPAGFLHVDGGNALFPVRAPNVPTEEHKKLALVIARSYAHMGINAFNVGAMDLAAGLPFLRDQAARAGESELPFLSANIVDPATGKPAFPASREFKIGERTVCVFGLTEPFTGDPTVQVSDPTAAAKTQIGELRPKCDLVVGLYAMSFHAASELARLAPGADLIIVSHPTSSQSPKPLVLGNTTLAQAGNKGMFVGRMDITILPTKPKSGTAIPAEERAKLEGQLARVVAQRKLLEGDITGDPQLAAVFKKAGEDEAALREKLGETASGFEYENAMISLDLQMPEEAQIAAWVKEAGVSPKSHGQATVPLPLAPSTPVKPGQ